MKLKAYESRLTGVWIIEPKFNNDSRGYFYESFNQKEFEKRVGIKPKFVQDNHSKSSKNVLRGLHYQIHKPQGKLVRVIQGEVFDVAVDIRVGSPNFGSWFGIKLNETNRKQLWIPPGFAHGFLVLSDTAELSYKCTDYFYPEDDHSLLWRDPEVHIKWPEIDGKITLSEKDRSGKMLPEAPVFELI